MSNDTLLLFNKLSFPFDFEGGNVFGRESGVGEDVVLQVVDLLDGFDFRGDLGEAQELPLLDAHEYQEDVVWNLGVLITIHLGKIS